MRVPAVAAAVGLIAETIGNLPVKLHDRETRLALKDHPAYRLTHEDANPWTSAEALRVQLTTDALLHGNGFALVLRDGAGVPRELHRIEPGSVSIETLSDGEPQYRVKLDQGEVIYSFRDILHVSAFGGVSPVVLGREAIGLALAFENHVAKLFANGGRPAGVLKHPGKLGDTGKTNLAKSWAELHGTDRAGGTAILDEGMSYEAITMTLTDAQFAENRLEQIREIARVFRVPPTMLFELTRGTWSNTEEMARQFLTVTLKPWLTTWVAAYARVLLSEDERRELYLEFVTDDLLTLSATDRADTIGKYRAAGVITSNEARGFLNLAPRPDGDDLTNPYITTKQPEVSE